MSFQFCPVQKNMALLSFLLASHFSLDDYHFFLSPLQHQVWRILRGGGSTTLGYKFLQSIIMLGTDIADPIS